ncbi:MAG TPA: hypothetical protein VIK38_12485 [Coriobacteriia bacterium]
MDPDRLARAVQLTAKKAVRSPHNGRGAAKSSLTAGSILLVAKMSDDSHIDRLRGYSALGGQAVSKRRVRRVAALASAATGIAEPKGRVAVEVNVLDLPVPANATYADECVVSDRGLSFEMCFVYEAPGTAAAAVRVVALIDSIVGQFWGSSRTFHESSREMLKAAGIAVVPVVTARAAPPAPAPVLANLFGMFRTGIGSVLDCYYLSPRDVFFAGRRHVKPHILPVARIMLPSPVLVGLLDYVESMVGSFRERLGISARDSEAK